MRPLIRGVLLLLLALLYSAPTRLEAQSPDPAQRCAMLTQGEDGIEACRAALRVDSLDAYSHHNLGWIFFRAGMVDSAVAQWLVTARLKPDYSKVYAALSQAASKTGKYPDALTYASRAVDLAPNDAENYAARMYALIGLRRNVDALESANREVELAPQNGRAYIDLGFALNVNDRPSDALAAVRTGLTLHSPPRQSYTIYAMAFDRLQQYREALAAADTAIRFDSTNAQAYVLRISVLARLHRTEELHAAQQALIRLRPNDITLQTSIATYNRVGQDSMAHLANALATADSGESLQMRGMHAQTLFNAGKKKDAILIMRDFVRHHPDNPDGWVVLGQFDAIAQHFPQALAEWRTAATLDATLSLRYPTLEKMRKELLQLAAQPPAATVADLDLPIPADPAPASVRTSPPVRLPSGAVPVGRVIVPSKK